MLLIRILSDVLGRIDADAFQDAFLQWVQAALPSLSGEQVCLYPLPFKMLYFILHRT